MNIQKFQKYSHEISPLYPALADKAEAISRAIENSPINVTAISDGDGILVKHIIDSLCCAEAESVSNPAKNNVSRFFFISLGFRLLINWRESKRGYTCSPN